MLQQLAPQVQSGQIKIVHHSFPVIGQESTWAAQASLCAADQNQFWSFSHFLYTHQGAENSGVFTQARIKQYAGQAGLDQAAFNSCFDGGKHTADVNNQLAEGRQRGVAATPTFFINGTKYEGLLPYDQMIAAINGAQAQGKPTP